MECQNIKERELAIEAQVQKGETRKATTDDDEVDDDDDDVDDSSNEGTGKQISMAMVTMMITMTMMMGFLE